MGGPFEGSTYRSAYLSGDGAFVDVSFGAQAADGALAAVALLSNGLVAESMPLGYGGVRSTRSLARDEVDALLTAARRAAGVGLLIVRALEGTGRVMATTSIVPLDTPPAERIEKKGRQSIRRAERAGCRVVRTSDPSGFLRLHRQVESLRAARYPEALLRLLAERGALTFYDVACEGDVVSSLAALAGGSHWMYWLAAQDERGRDVEAGYPAVAALLQDAYEAGAVFVNLGASAGLPGVAAFKRRLGGIDRPVLELVSAPASVRARRAVGRLVTSSRTALRTEAAVALRRLGLRRRPPGRVPGGARGSLD